MTDKSQQFASDNYSGICPEAWAAMEQANHGHQRAYGDDEWTLLMKTTKMKRIMRMNTLQ